MAVIIMGQDRESWERFIRLRDELAGAIEEWFDLEGFSGGADLYPNKARDFAERLLREGWERAD